MSSSSSETPILSDQLIKSKKKVKVKLYSDRIDFGDEHERAQTVFLQDVSGSSLSKTKENETNAYLTVYTYIKNPKNNKRKREEIVLEFSNFGSHEENFAQSKKWDTELKSILNKNQSQKPYLILVNPKSGAGKAENVFYERVLPLLSEAKLPYHLILTEYANFAKEYIKTAKLADYCGIIAISGDGLIYEIVNGLTSRDDHQTAIKKPIAQIPGGSGNALACSVSQITNETFQNLSLQDFATSVTFNLIKSKPTPMDFWSIQLSDNTVVKSFLSIQWAIIADVDLESENYRYLGELRFTVGAIKRILDLRVYRGRISFLPADDMVDYKPKDPSIQISRNNNEQTTSSSENSEFKYLRPFDEPVPNDWLIVEDNFVFFLLMNLPMLTYDFLAARDSKFNDGHMHLMFIKSSITRFQLIKLLHDTTSGNHIESPFVEYIKVKAFRLEPLPLEPNGPNIGNIMVDGEKVPYGCIQGEVLPSLGNLFAFEKN